MNWNVDVDERWVILGPNGAGKTTLLQIAAAQLFPTSGRVHILGERLGAFDVSEIRPRIGLSSAALAGRVPPMETVIDVVVSAGYGVVGRWREQYDDLDFARGRELLDAMGIARLADRTYGTLSEGERKRTLAARALMADPELLLLDEPAAGLDLAGREDLLARLSTLAVDPFAPTTLLVTHHVEEIPTAFSHVLLMRGGKVIGAGPMARNVDPGVAVGDLRHRTDPGDQGRPLFRLRAVTLLVRSVSVENVFIPQQCSLHNKGGCDG